MPQQAEQSAALTTVYVAQQKLVAATLTRDLVLLLRAVFSVTDPGASWAATKMALGSLIRDRRRISADLASRYYLNLRELSVPAAPARTRAPGPPTRLVAPTPPAPRIVPAQPSDLSPDRLDVTLTDRGIVSYQRAIRAGKPAEKARDTMAVNLSGAAQTLALEGGREVIHETVAEDAEAIGWVRVTDADPCAFCAMLASRGAVYRSADTAGGAANKRFVGDGMFKFHNHDGCTAVPVFHPDDPALRRAEDLYDLWLRETARHSGKAALDAWTSYWDNRPDKPASAVGEG